MSAADRVAAWLDRFAAQEGQHAQIIHCYDCNALQLTTSDLRELVEVWHLHHGLMASESSLRRLPR